MQERGDDIAILPEVERIAERGANPRALEEETEFLREAAEMYGRYSFGETNREAFTEVQARRNRQRREQRKALRNISFHGP
jgi:hypothetical protein